MRKGSRAIRILLSFVGTNDKGKSAGDLDGAVLTVFKRRSFDEVHLLWNPSDKGDFQEIAKYVRDEILERGYCNSVTLHRFDCENVTDHDEIYPKLFSLCASLKPSSTRKFTAAIASGTPAMQVCWILMAESGDLPLELIRSNEPRFGKALVTPVKLGTGLPRILRLEEENRQLREENRDLLPVLEIRVRNGSIRVGDVSIELAPVEFSYYRYFAERAMAGEEPERFSGIDVPDKFLKTILQYHEESFPESDLFRAELKSMLKNGRCLSMGTFRANVSKANTRIRKSLNKPSLIKFFEIAVEGKRHAKMYGIRAPSETIVIKP
jgi:hypothetical protein